MLSAPAGNIDEASTSHKAQSSDNCISETTDLKVLSSPLTVDGNTLTEMRSWDFQNRKQHETTWFSVSEFWGPHHIEKEEFWFQPAQVHESC